MVEELILAGADIIKVGIGPGSVCTTRKKTVGLSPCQLNLTCDYLIDVFQTIFDLGCWISSTERCFGGNYN